MYLMHLNSKYDSQRVFKWETKWDKERERNRDREEKNRWNVAWAHKRIAYKCVAIQTIQVFFSNQWLHSSQSLFV